MGKTKTVSTVSLQTKDYKAGGQMVVINREGQDVKSFKLNSGAILLGTHCSCEIRVILPNVAPQHAILSIHTNKAVIRNMTDRPTFVNGNEISVHVLDHGDVITLGDRCMRWEYNNPEKIKSHTPQPVMVPSGRGHHKSRARTRGNRGRNSEQTLRKLDPEVTSMLELKHRASLPAGTKQVAIVQPQRRVPNMETSETKTRLTTTPNQNVYPTNRVSRKSTRPEQNVLNSSEIVSGARETRLRNTPKKVANTPKKVTNTPKNDAPKPKTPRGRPSKETVLTSSQSSETKASQWIASRKNSPRNVEPRTPKNVNTVHVATPRPKTPYVDKSPTKKLLQSPRRVVSLRKTTPLRTLVLRKAVTPKITPRKSPKGTPKLSAGRSVQKNKVEKIQAPLTVDKNKQLALMLLTRTPKSKLLSPKGSQSPMTPSLLIKKNTPVNTSNSGRKSKLTRNSKTLKSLSRAPRASSSQSLRQSSNRISNNGSIENSDFEEPPSKIRRSNTSYNEGLISPLPPSPKKSSLKKSTSIRKSESIKFDLSNLDHNNSSDVMVVSSTSGPANESFESEEDLTLHYSDTDTSPTRSPCPRRSIHSRSSKMLEKCLGQSPIMLPNRKSSVNPRSPSATSARSSAILQRVQTANSTFESDRSPNTSRQSSLKTSPNKTQRSNANIESYSIVDLVSLDTSNAATSVYDSADSDNNSVSFGTPTQSDKRSPRLNKSSVLPTYSSTPFLKNTSRTSNRGSQMSNVDRTVDGVKRSLSTPSTSNLDKTRDLLKTKRSKSLSTPVQMGKSITINSTLTNSRRGNESTYLESSAYSQSTSGSTRIISLGENMQTPPSLRRSRADTLILSPTNSTRHSNNSERNTTPDNSSRRSSRSILAEILSSTDKNISPTTLNKRGSSSRKNTLTGINVDSPTNTQNSRRSSPLETPSSTKGRHSSKSILASSSFETPVNTNRSGSSRTNTETDETNAGQTTPENAVSPGVVGTPTLNMESLLNISAQSQLRRRGLSRKTIGVIHKKSSFVSRRAETEPKKHVGRKYLKRNLSNVRKVLIDRTSNESVAFDRTDENNRKISNDENVTPKSSVKLVPEAVKHQHSTAKKPKSKRSIIDNLDDSDIGKHLFHSPVKRKLSQSMTEFGKKYDSDDESPTYKKKQTRRTIHLSGRTPNETFDIGMEESPQVPTDIFISPLNTPVNSPIGKKSIAKNSPSVISHKTLHNKKASRQKEPNNDLTDVRGVKRVFEMRSPRNDLRRVTGIKTLFQSEKKSRTPRNDLTDVRGVKKLFTAETSPRSDVRNAKGVKRKTEDFRFVKNLFRQDKSQNGLDDLSGVEELFDISDNSRNADITDTEILFDKLVGKPIIKSTYSKSFISKKEKAAQQKASHSLSVPLDQITSNVEEWIESEFNKVVPLKSNTTKDKTKDVSMKHLGLPRELMRLSTQTLEGDSPIRHSRSRITTVNVSKSTSNIDRSLLPLKKRSFLNDTSNNIVLPIKKRIMVHSTPVKGKRGTIHVTNEMGRVSPIGLAENNDDSGTVATQTKLQSPKFKNTTQGGTKTTKGTRGRPSSKEQKLASPKPVTANTTPKRTRQSKAHTQRSPAKRATRGRPKNVDVITTKSNNRQTLVIAKKAAILSPEKPDRKLKPQNKVMVTASPKFTPKKLSPLKKRTRGAKSQESPKIVSPVKKRTTRGAKPKDSPKKVKPDTPKPVRNTRGKQSKPVTPKAKSKIEKKKAVTPKPVRSTRGGKPVKAVTPKPKSRAQNKRNSLGPAIVISKPSPNIKRAKRSAKEPPIDPTKNVSLQKLRKVTRSNKVIKDLSPVVKQETRSRKAEPLPESPKGRKRKIDAAESIESLKPRRGRKAAVNIQTPIEEPKNVKKGGTRAQNKSVEKATKTQRRGRSNVEEQKEELEPRGRKRKADTLNSKEKATVKTGRNPRKTEEAVVTGRRGRNRIVSSPQANKSFKGQVVEAKAVKGRKRKVDSMQESELVKVVAKRPARNTKPGAEAKSPARGRSTRAKTTAVANTVTGPRSNRRR